mmetsp:Transcript_26933/g.88379  ORF Transcript_26933/g.88379 Transcript_26933/m.88379 type:complete len:378 (+) Transcript_26933:1365-2498(+)
MCTTPARRAMRRGTRACGSPRAPLRIISTAEVQRRRATACSSRVLAAPASARSCVPALRRLLMRSSRRFSASANLRLASSCFCIALSYCFESRAYARISGESSSAPLRGRLGARGFSGSGMRASRSLVRRCKRARRSRKMLASTTATPPSSSRDEGAATTVASRSSLSAASAISTSAPSSSPSAARVLACAAVSPPPPPPPPAASSPTSFCSKICSKSWHSRVAVSESFSSIDVSASVRPVPRQLDCAAAPYATSPAARSLAFVCCDRGASRSIVAWRMSMERTATASSLEPASLPLAPAAPPTQPPMLMRKSDSAVLSCTRGCPMAELRKRLRKLFAERCVRACGASSDVPATPFSASESLRRSLTAAMLFASKKL